MTDPIPTILRARARRRIEKLVANPQCEANVLAAAHDISMEAVARAEGLEPKVGLSPFARQRGENFEKAQFQDDAASLREALIEEGALSLSATGFIDLRPSDRGSPARRLAESAKRFEELLSDPRSFRGIIAGPGLVLPGTIQHLGGLMAADFVLLDAMDGALTLTVGEIKSYPDLDGYTDPAQISGTRAQAGLYHHVLSEMLQDLGASAPALSPWGVIVLARPGLSANRPSVRAREDLAWQAARAGRALEALKSAFDASPELASLGHDDAKAIGVIAAAGTCYAEHCSSFCERAEGCRRLALEKGQGVALGEDVARLLGSISIPRSAALLTGANPNNDLERDFVARTNRLRGFAV